MKYHPLQQYQYKNASLQIKQSTPQTLTHSNHRQLLQGVGIAIDDSGHFLIAQWKNNKVDGQYLLYKPNLIQQCNSQRFYNGICQYGSMHLDNLQGQNYIYHCSRDAIRGLFSHNKLTGKCYIHNKKKQNQSQQAYQCEVIDFNSQPAQFNRIDLSSITADKQPVKLQMVQRGILLTPVDFLKKFVEGNKVKKDTKVLEVLRISQDEYFFGFLKGQKGQNIQISQKCHQKKMFNGFGIIFRNNRPIKYGLFQNGKLQGLGRMYQTQMNILDGIFSKDKLLEGFLLDHFNDKMHFGKQSPLDNTGDNQFVIIQSFRCQEMHYLLQYKKQYHLKSLCFKNNYFQMPVMAKQSPWPLIIVNKLYKSNTMNTIIKSFQSPVKAENYSLIEQKGQYTDRNLQRQIFQQMKGIVHHGKDRYGQKMKRHDLLNEQIQRHLRQKDNKGEFGFNQYIKEYHKIQSKINLIEGSNRKETFLKPEPELTNITAFNKSPSHPKSIHPKEQSTKSKPHLFPSNQNNHKPQDIAEAPQAKEKGAQTENKDLKDLIQEYKECQTARNRNNHKTSDMANNQIKSRNELIKMDHQTHFPQQYINQHGPQPGSTSKRSLKGLSYRKQDIFLDQIYQQHLSHH